MSSHARHLYRKTQTRKQTNIQVLTNALILLIKILNLSTNLRISVKFAILKIILSYHAFIYTVKLIPYELVFNPPTPVAQKVAVEVVFRRFQGEGVKFKKIRTSLPPSDF